jgi:hypothetical protein
VTRLSRRMARPLTLLIAALALVAGLAGCGNATHEPRTFAETEGLYLELDELEYQIQISRQLNPSDVEDADYLRGIPETVEPPTPEEAWFAVFLRVQNQSDHAIETASSFEIEAADATKFTPIPLDAEANPFAYDATELRPGGLLPPLDSAASNNNPIRGSMVLFKLPYAAFHNRPLEFHIKPLGGETGIVDLDV